jgi:hypothetical protein
MAIILSSGSVTGVSLPLSRFPFYHARHLAVVAKTHRLEKDGAALIAAGFPSAQLDQFIRDVCKWGNYPGIAGRVLKHNSAASISRQFASATAAFTSASPASAALSALISIKGLGLSFASKHLRFLRPDICPVLDSQLSRDCHYPLSLTDYQRFSNDCLAIAAGLNAAGGALSLPTSTPWGAADVEMSIFACLYLC